MDGTEGVHDLCLSSALPHLPVKGGWVRGDKQLLPCVLLGNLVSLLPEGEDRAARWDRKEDDQDRTAKDQELGFGSRQYQFCHRLCGLRGHFITQTHRETWAVTVPALWGGADSKTSWAALSIATAPVKNGYNV